ncbi:MAG: CHASE3 domain-containing protein [Pirellulales bacterium]
MTKLESSLRRRWLRGLAFWNRVPIRAQGGILALIPLVAVLVSFVFAAYGNYRRGGIEYDVHRRFQLVRQYDDLLNLMIDAETGERGYLLTKQPAFLEPYDRAVAEIPNKLEALRQTILLEPGETPRLERLRLWESIRALSTSNSSRSSVRKASI